MAGGAGGEREEETSPGARKGQEAMLLLWPLAPPRRAAHAQRPYLGPLKAPFVLLASARQGLIHLKIAFKKGGRARATGALAGPHRL